MSIAAPTQPTTGTTDATVPWVGRLSASPRAPQGNRLTEQSPDYTRLHAATVAKLRASVDTLLRDLRAAQCGDGTVPAAQHAFIVRHTALLREAYLEAHAVGTRHYWQQFSREPAHWERYYASTSQPRTRTVQQRLLFYAAGSVTKMASQAAQALHDGQVQAQAQRQATLAESSADTVRLAGGGGSVPDPTSDPMDLWAVGIQGRIGLQAEVTWSGMNDGYSAAGAVDPASKYALMYWQLGAAKQHCASCPEYAAGSPYGPPGSGFNELDATPGDGHTKCGAACHCVLSYGMDEAAMARDAGQALGVREFFNRWADRTLPPGAQAPVEQLPLDLATLTTEQQAEFGVSELLGMSRADLVATYQEALDRYRQASVDWLNHTITNLAVPMQSVDDFLAQVAGAEDASAAQALLRTLTDTQRRLFIAALGGIVDADLAQQVADALGYGALWDQTQGPQQGGQLAEPTPDDRVVLFNPNHDPHSGRFAPSGGAGGIGEHEHESGGGSVHAPHGIAEAHGEHASHAHGGQGSAGGAHEAGHVAIPHDPAKLGKWRNATKLEITGAQTRIQRAQETLTRLRAQYDRGTPEEKRTLEPRVRQAVSDLQQHQDTHERLTAALHASYATAQTRRTALGLPAEVATAGTSATPRATLRVEDERARQALARQYGHLPTTEEAHALAQAAGALPGGEALFTRLGQLKADGVLPSGATYEARSGLSTLENGGRALHLSNFTVNRDPHAAYDLSVLREQVVGARRAGLEGITTQARPLSTDRVHLVDAGFDVPVREALHESRRNPQYAHTISDVHQTAGTTRALAPEPPASFLHATKLSEALQHADARDWWTRYGVAPHLLFDLKDPTALARFDTYLKANGLPGLEASA